MKKSQFVFCCLFFFSVSLFAQPTPTKGITEYGKLQVPCYKIEVPYPADVAEEAIKKKFKGIGVSGKERKGFIQFKNVNIPKVSDKSVDAYVKVERKSKKEKDASNITLFFTEPGIEPGTPETNGATFDAAVASAGAFGLLSAISDNTGELSLEQDIKVKEQAVKDADNEYRKLQKEGNSLQDKLKKVQNDIEENNKNQTKLTEELAKRKGALEEAKGLKKIAPGNQKNQGF